LILQGRRQLAAHRHGPRQTKIRWRSRWLGLPQVKFEIARIIPKIGPGFRPAAGMGSANYTTDAVNNMIYTNCHLSRTSAMNDAGKSAYADAVANTVAGFVDDLAANSRTVFCSPDGKEERTIPVGEEGEAFVGIKVNPDVLMNQIGEKAIEFNQRAPSYGEWAAVCAHFDAEAERVVLKATSGDDVATVAVLGSLAVGMLLVVPTFGLSLAITGTLGGLWGAKRREKHESEARDANTKLIAALHQKAVNDIRARKEQIVGAILACNS
jgi:hypothetical protein